MHVRKNEHFFSVFHASALEVVSLSKVTRVTNYLLIPFVLLIGPMISLWSTVKTYACAHEARTLNDSTVLRWCFYASRSPWNVPCVNLMTNILKSSLNKIGAPTYLQGIMGYGVLLPYNLNQSAKLLSEDGRIVT